MNAVFEVARIIFGAIFITSGFNHFAKTEGMAGYAKSKGVFAPKLSVLLSGAILFLGGVSVILGIYADLGALLLSGLLVIMALKMHDFWTQTDPQGKQLARIMFMKDFTLAGGALFIFAVAAAANSEYGWKITESLFSINR